MRYSNRYERQMQGMIRQLVVWTTGTFLLVSPAWAFGMEAIEIGSTGQVLPNQASGGLSTFTSGEGRLEERLAGLLADVDCLLARLHALPPELPRRTPESIPAGGELAGLIERALAGNPGLGVYRGELAVEAARTRQAGAAPDPVITFKLSGFPVSQLEPDTVPMTQYVFGWSQQFEGYGKRRLRQRIAGLEEDLTELELTKEELATVEALTQVYFTMAATRARLEILDDNAALTGLMIELAESKYALGNTPQGRIMEAQTRLTRIEEQRINLNRMLDAQFEMLLGILGRPADLTLDDLTLQLDYPLTSAADWDAEELFAAAVERDPALQHLEVLAQQQQWRVELAGRDQHPDYTLSASYGIREGDRDLISAGIAFPLQTHRRERQDAAVQEAYAGLNVTASKAETRRNMLATRLGSLRVEQDRIHELAGLYRDGLVPQARLTLDSMIAGYAANQIDLAELLTAQQNLLAYETELEQLYIDYIAVLHELQIASAGAFDPAPYLAVPGAAGISGHTGVDDALDESIAAAELERTTQVLDTTPGVTVDSRTQAPAIAQSFLAGLNLPRTTVDAPADEAEAGEAEPVTQAETAESETNDDFYQPFKAREDGQDDE